MANKSQPYAQEIITGVFVAAIVILLAFFTVVISGVDLIRGSRMVTRRVRFEHIGALKMQDPVYVRGMKVGSVQQLALGQGCVMVTLRMDAAVAVREDYAVTVGKSSLLGGGCVEIAEGSSGAPLPPETELQGTSPADVMKDLGELVASLRQSVDPADVRDTLENARKASADIAELTGRVRRGDGLVGQLFTPGGTGFGDLQASLANLRVLTDDVRAGKGLVGKLLREEDGTYEDLRVAVGGLRAVSEGLRDGKGLVGKLLREEDGTYDDLRGALANIRAVTAKLNDPSGGMGRLLAGDSPLVSDLEATIANLKTVTARLERGDGTLGKLVNDDAVATQLESAIKDVRQIIDNMRDTAPITTFTSLFFSGL